MAVVGYAAPQYIVDTVSDPNRRGAYRVRVRGALVGGEVPYAHRLCRAEEAGHISGVLEDWHAAHWDTAVEEVTHALRRAGRAALSEYEVAELLEREPNRASEPPTLSRLRDGAWWAALDAAEAA